LTKLGGRRLVTSAAGEDVLIGGAGKELIVGITSRTRT
jgi:hypothetical protein